MAKTAYLCRECAYRTLQWRGRCPECGVWDSLSAAPEGANAVCIAPPRTLASVDCSAASKVPTGIGEFDRVLGGGLVAGSVVLVAGEPGVGKSTLMLQAAAGLAARAKVMFVCGEESVEQVASRAHRIGKLDGAMASAETDLPSVAAQIAPADVAIVDSIQSLKDPALPGEPGSVSQVRGCAAALSRAARASRTAVMLVGHVTKDGSVAGPRALEHLVDAVLSFEGDRSQTLRTIRATKNRFGPTSEIGVFEMTASGLTEVKDASGLLLKDRKPGIPGSAVASMLEGRRPVVIEIQTLVSKAAGTFARRTPNGIDPARLAMIVAVLQQRAGIDLSDRDIWASVAGGLRASEPGVDLALAMALASSRLNRPLPADAAFIGEVGLAGEVRSVPGMQSRLEEVARLGLKRVIAPPFVSSQDAIRLIGVSEVGEALCHL